MKNFNLALLFALLVVTTSASAQVAYVLRMPGTVGTEGHYLPSAQYPAGANSGSPYVPTLALPHFSSGAVLPAILSGQGGHAIDQHTGRMISSDGLQIWEEPHPSYPATFAPNPPVPAPLITTIGSPLMGLGADSTHGVVWMCDVNGFQPFTSAWPHAAVGGAVTPGFAHSQFTGIAFETSTGTLWLSDIQGCIYHCTVTGAAIGTQPVNCVPASLKGIAVNSTRGPGSILPPACSTQNRRFRIITTDGIKLIDALWGTSYPLGTVGDAYGLAYSSDGQFSFGGSPWVGSGVLPAIRTPGPVINIASLPCRLDGAMPGATAFLLYGACPLPVPVACGLGAVRVFDGYVAAPINATGSAQLSIPIAGAPAGVQFTLQWAFSDPLQPCGWVFTDALTLTVGLP
jgi:hypothetical protein